MFNDSELTKANKGVWIFFAAYPAVLLVLMTLPNNQYGIMAANQTVTGTADSVLPSLLNLTTVFQIMGLAILVVLGVLGLMTGHLQTNHMETVLDNILAGFVFVFHTIFFISALISGNQGNVIISFGNIITYTAHLLFYLGFICLSVFFVYRPYRQLLKKADEMDAEGDKIQQAYNEKVAAERDQYRQEMAGFDKEQMKAYLKEKLDQGQITQDQYEMFLRQLGE